MSDFDGLIIELRKQVEQKDKQIGDLVEERNRLRGVVKQYMTQREEDTRKIGDLYLALIELSAVAKEWLENGRFLAGNSAEKNALVERTQRALKETQ